MTDPIRRVDYPRRVERSLAITNVSVIPMDSERVLADHTVVIEDGVITRVAPARHADVTSMQVVDGTGRYLLPGLADMHMHLGDPVDVIAMRDAGDLLLYLAYGVTTVRNMWGSPYALRLRALVESGDLPGPHIITSSPLVDGVLPNGKPAIYRSVLMTEPEQAKPLVTSYAERGYDQIKAYSFLNPETLRSLGQASAATGVLMTGHCPEGMSWTQAADAGMRCFEHLLNVYTGMARDGSDLAEPYDANPDAVERLRSELDWDALRRVADRLASEQIWNCPTSIVTIGMPPLPGFDPPGSPAAAKVAGCLSPVTSAIRSAHPSLTMPLPGEPPAVAAARAMRDELRLRVLQLLHEHGAPLLTGTDAPLVLPGISLHDELALLVRAGLTPYQALRCATVEPARFMAQAGEWGNVAVGQRADLLLVDRNPLTDITATSEIAGVFVNGFHLSRQVIDALLAARSEHVTLPLVPPALPEPLVAGTAIESGVLEERRFGVTTSVIAYRHHRAPDGTLHVDEVQRSHTRERTMHFELDEACRIDTAEIRERADVGTESVTVRWTEGRYRAGVTSIDGNETDVTIGTARLVPSDTMAATVLQALARSGIAAGEPVDALHADAEAVEVHRLTFTRDGDTYSVVADHPREQDITLQCRLTDDGTIAGIVSTIMMLPPGAKELVTAAEPAEATPSEP